MLKLYDLIELAGVELQDFKIHCATSHRDPPLQAHFEGRFKEWQEYQNQRNFQCKKILSLIQLSPSRWLFVGVWKVNGVQPKSNRAKSWFQYSTSEAPGLDHLTGRVIVSFKRTFRASYLKGPRYSEYLTVSEILPDKMSLKDFPGFSSVLLKYGELCLIVSENIASWRSALSSVAGVYLITDTSCGRHYVGSAYGIQGIWGRWSTYADLPHGSNKKLKQLLSDRGNLHANHFTFSILEICDILATKEEVVARESHWKEALSSRDFGYNEN